MGLLRLCSLLPTEGFAFLRMVCRPVPSERAPNEQSHGAAAVRRMVSQWPRCRRQLMKAACSSEVSAIHGCEAQTGVATVGGGDETCRCIDRRTRSRSRCGAPAGPQPGRPPRFAWPNDGDDGVCRVTPACCESLPPVNRWTVRVACLVRGLNITRMRRSNAWSGTPGADPRQSSVVVDLA